MIIDLRNGSTILKMATIAIMIFGAIISATAFTAGNVIAKKFSGTDEIREESNEETKRHNEATEKFNKDLIAYNRKKQEFEDWEEKRALQENNASNQFKTTDEALKYYNKTHPVSQLTDDEPPTFSNYYQPSSSQKNGELIYVGAGMFVLTYLATKLI